MGKVSSSGGGGGTGGKFPPPKLHGFPPKHLPLIELSA